MPKVEDHTPADAKLIFEQLQGLAAELENLLPLMRQATKESGQAALTIAGSVNARKGIDSLTRYLNQLSAAIKLQQAKNRQTRR